MRRIYTLVYKLQFCVCSIHKHYWSKSIQGNDGPPCPLTEHLKHLCRYIGLIHWIHTFNSVSSLITGIFSVFNKVTHTFGTLSKPLSLQLSGGALDVEHLGNFQIELWISWSDMHHCQSALISLCCTGAQVHMNNTRGKCQRRLLSAPIYAKNKSI